MILKRVKADVGSWYDDYLEIPDYCSKFELLQKYHAPMMPTSGKLDFYFFVSKILEKILKIIMYYNLHKGHNMTWIMRSMKWPSRDRQMIKALPRSYESYK